MGKKHKKHKGDKHGFEGKTEYVEKPLKLVLKVGGNEVTELSTGSSGHDSGTFETFEDKSDHEKHKDKKKKKKKKGEKEKHSPEPEVVEEKKKKKTEKKKKSEDSMDTDLFDQERSQTPLRADLLPEKSISTSLAKPEEKELTPLQEALTQLVRQLQRKDPSAFFSFPVTDLIAPGYSLIIKHPMDFSAMKEKVKKEEYQCLEELKADFRTMCENAMAYNKPDTIYFKAAKKLLHSGMKILSQERIQSLKQSIDFMIDLETTNSLRCKEEFSGTLGESSRHSFQEQEESMDLYDGAKSPSKASKEYKSQENQEFLKNSSTAVSEQELQQIEQLIEESGGKLTRRGVESQFQFERRRADGTTSLGFLNPSELSVGDPGYCPVKLGMLSGRLQSGVNTLQGFKEDKRNKITPVSYVNYGPYSSYAPVYDSSFANISKEDSDLVYSFFGDESSLQGSDSIQEFLTKSEDHIYRHADNILDAVTNGEHSRRLREMNMFQMQARHTCFSVLTVDENEEFANQLELASDAEVMEADAGSRVNFASLSAVMGLDTESPAFDSKEVQMFQQKLDETTQLLRELQGAQNERLGVKPPPSIICLLAPSSREIQLAEKVTENLKLMASQVAPGDITSIHGIRKALAITVPLGMQMEPNLDLTTDSSAINTENQL
ncbi:bromodomain-containing protein 7 isoform X1 [Erpetoichthys calabaricus]|uniref:bromodomain-containing protein 7 isoform X1 n=1 Tax=Erpetoichthys calabaricus TaxID=27687 RepID=UPI00223442F1|nr:bromodomain-containing protein 7 isoform X1 [Erpetoichthys calabaricus]